MAKTMTFDIHSTVRVYDGDTIRVLLDRGFHDYSERTVRLRGIDAPEKHGPTKAQGQKVRAAVAQWLAVGRGRGLKLVSYAVEDDKYGRVIGDIICNGGSLGRYLLANGLAKQYDGRRKAEWLPLELVAIDDFKL